MGIIHKLSSCEAQKIAAGEVVERPYNIVKELLENALDAQATQITLYIQDGGKQLIRCIDNGVGMSQEDALMSLEHHATSKLSTIEDLETLQTFGFRGEALSSMCAISKMALATQTHDSDHGIKLTLEGAILIKQEIISQAPGTDIGIADIFFNIPARKKFLKTRETEWRSIYTLVQAVALAHHQVAFALHHDNQLVLNTYATESLSERVSQIFDRSFAQNFLTCQNNDAKNNITISGGVAHYQYQRYDRNQQFFFVNKRWVKNYKLGHAFTKGFQNVMPPGKHPAGIIFITVPQHEVDINVHPRKEEVVFLHPRLVELSLETMVQKRLEESTAQRVKAPEYSQANYTAPKPIEQLFTQAKTSRPKPFFNQDFKMPERALIEIPSSMPQPHVTQQTIHTQAPKIDREVPSYTIIGQLLKTYLLLETAEGLLVVDQHAAHESVLYEQFSSKTNEVARVQLLFPEIVHVEGEQQKILLKLIPELNSIGIHIEAMGETAVAVTETPLYIKNYNLKDLVHDLLSWLSESTTIDADVWNTKISKKLYAMMACKAAVKAGDELSSLQIEELLKSLYKTEHRLTCPHGRPTTWLISQYELEKTFKRKL